MPSNVTLFKWVSAIAMALAMGAAPARAVPIKRRFIHFRAAQISVLQSDGNFFSGVASFNPELSLTRLFGLTLGGGVSTLASQGSYFSVFEYQAGLMIYSFTDFALELAYGRQIWTGNGGSNPLYSATVMHGLGGRVIDRVFVGYSFYQLENWPTHEIRVGLCL